MMPRRGAAASQTATKSKQPQGEYPEGANTIRRRMASSETQHTPEVQRPR